MDETFSQASRDILAKAVIAHVASIGPDGWPQVTPVWVELDGEDILFNTALGRAKSRNMAANPRVALSLTDPDDPEVSVALRGTVMSMKSEGADEHDDHLNVKYNGVGSLKLRPEGQVRVIVRVRVDHIATQPS